MSNVNIKIENESFVINSKNESIRDSMNDISSKIVSILEDDEKECIAYIVAISVTKINTIISKTPAEIGDIVVNNIIRRISESVRIAN